MVTLGSYVAKNELKILSCERIGNTDPFPTNLCYSTLRNVFIAVLLVVILEISQFVEGMISEF